MDYSLPKEICNMQGDDIPSIFSFIVCRREHTGGFLFNPYLFNEIPLNDIELSILEHCNGHFSLSEITKIISDEFSLSHNLAQKYVYGALMLFEGRYAINWKKQKNGTQEFPAGSKNPFSSSRISAVSDCPDDILSSPLSVLWELTHECNLRCKHCLINAGKREQNELSLDEIKKIIDELAELKVFTITLGGGEPLLRKDFLGIVDYASQFNFGLKLSTNGILVDNDLLDRLKDTNVFSVQVSIDGFEQTHNAFRGNKKSFEKAVSALKMFSGAGYWTIMSTAITRHNVNEIARLVELAVECGASSFKASPFIPVGNGKENFKDLAITPSDLKDLTKIMLQKKEKYEGIIDLQIDGLFPWLSGPCSGGRQNSQFVSSQVGCSAGTSEVVITPTGDVLPCPFLTDFNAGNLRNNSLRGIWYNSEIFGNFRNLKSYKLEGICRDCEYVPHYCQGGCRAAAFAFSGNLFAADPYCWKDRC